MSHLLYVFHSPFLAALFCCTLFQNNQTQCMPQPCSQAAIPADISSPRPSMMPIASSSLALPFAGLPRLRLVIGMGAPYPDSESLVKYLLLRLRARAFLRHANNMQLHPCTRDNRTLTLGLPALEAGRLENCTRPPSSVIDHVSAAHLPAALPPEFAAFAASTAAMTSSRTFCTAAL